MKSPGYNNSLQGVLHLCQCQQCEECLRRSNCDRSDCQDIGPEDTLPTRLLRGQRAIYKRRTNPSIRAHKLTAATSRSHSMNAADFPTTSTSPVEESSGRNGSLSKRTLPGKVADTTASAMSKSSQFILDFDDLGLGLEPEAVQSQPGVELRQAVQSAFDKRHLTLEGHNVFLKNSNTPLPWQGHVECLDGQTVLAKVKDTNSPKQPPNSHSTLRLTNSGAQLNRKPQHRHSYVPHSNSNRSTATATANNNSSAEWFLPDSSGMTANSLSVAPILPGTLSGTTPVKRKQQRERGSISSLFKSDKQVLEDKLNAYNNQLPSIETLFLRSGVDIAQKMSEMNIESSWRDICTDWESLTKRERDHQAAVWELVETERNHINRLVTLLQFYLVFIETNDLIGDIKAELVFGNVIEVFLATLAFWRSGLEPMLTVARLTHTCLDPTLLTRGFEDISAILKPYYDYQILHEERTKQINHVAAKNEQFQLFIQWAEKQESSGRQKFKDLLSEPCQRLFKYNLLLERMAKYTRDSATHTALQKMLMKAKDFLHSINFGKGFKDQFDLLTTIMATIESYDYIEFASEELAKLCRSYCAFNLTQPMLGCPPQCLRQLYKRGSLKLKEGGNRLDVFCFLFTDMFLMGKSVMRKADKIRIKVIREPYHIDRILLCQLETEGLGFIYLNEFGVATTAFTLQGSNEKENHLWLDMFKAAKDSYMRHKTEPNKFTWNPPIERHYANPSDRTTLKESQVVRIEPNLLSRRNSSSSPAIDSVIPPGRPKPNLQVAHGRSSSMDVTLMSSQNQQEQQEILVNHSSDVTSDSDCSSNHSSRTLKSNDTQAEQNFEMFTRGAAGPRDSHQSSIYVKSGKHSIRKRLSPHRSGPKRTSLKRYSSVAPSVAIPETTANGGCLSAPMRVPTDELLNDFGPEIFAVPPAAEDINDSQPQSLEENHRMSEEFKDESRPSSEEFNCSRPTSEVFQPQLFDEIRRQYGEENQLEADVRELDEIGSMQTSTEPQSCGPISSKLSADEPLVSSFDSFSSPTDSVNITVEPTTTQPRLDDLGELVFTTDNYSHPSLTEQRSFSPFGKSYLPSPVFFSTVNGSCDGDSSSANGYDSSPTVSARNSSDFYDISQPQAELLGSTPPPPPPPTLPPPIPNVDGFLPTQQQRRVDRRYHTADAIEPVQKSHGDPIYKRHSWNISSHNRTTATPATFPYRNCNCLSSESFCSSSGVSSSDSQLCVFSPTGTNGHSHNGYVSSVSVSDDFDSPPGDVTPQQTRKDINQNRIGLSPDDHQLVLKEEFLTREELLKYLSRGQVESSDV